MSVVAANGDPVRQDTLTGLISKRMGSSTQKPEASHSPPPCILPPTYEPRAREGGGMVGCGTPSICILPHYGPATWICSLKAPGLAKTQYVEPMLTSKHRLAKEGEVP